MTFTISMVLLMLLMGALGVPVAIAIGLPTFLIIFLTTDIPLKVVPHMMASAVNSFPLMAIPFFLLAGNLMNTGGITRRIFRFGTSLVGHIPGGLGHVNVVASMIFAGMSGSAVADAGGLGVVEIEAMKQAGYDIDFSVGITAASCIIGPIIPPSIIFVLYGVLAGASIGALFLAGFVPGVIMGLVLMIRVYVISRRKSFPIHPRSSFRELFQSFKGAFPALLTPLIIIGGILFGVFTPTEASVVAVVYAVVLGVFAYREFTLKSFLNTLFRVAIQSAAIMFITANACVLSWLLAREQVPQILAQSILSLTENRFLILLMVNAFLLVNGCFMEVIASLIILTPILAPMMEIVGVDLVHFGVVMTVNMMIGLLTPPLGMGLYTVQKVSGISFDRVARASFGFILPLIGVLFLITYVPQLVTFLPRLLMGS